MTELQKGKSMTDTREPTLTRAEELRDNRFTNGAWQTANLNPMFPDTPSRDLLLRRIATSEEALSVLALDSKKANAKADRANSEAERVNTALRNLKDDLDVYKIMLAEQMEIPR